MTSSVGRCETCRHRDADGYCNSSKLAEDEGQQEAQRQDMLIYSYSESGAFWVGPKFGCVHHANKE